MKKLIYIVITLLAFNSCKAQNKIKMEQKIIIPQIDKEFEKFNIKKFNDEVDTISKKRKIINKNEIIVEEYQSYGYIHRKYLNDSYFMVSKKYYKNGHIKQKSISFNNGYPINSIYEFNEKGKLIKEINTDEGYNFGWDKILEYCEKNSITLEKGYPKQGGIKTEIFKNEEDGNKVWTITYYNYKKELYLGLTLDGKTGKLLNEQIIELEGN